MEDQRFCGLLSKLERSKITKDSVVMMKFSNGIIRFWIPSLKFELKHIKEKQYDLMVNELLNFIDYIYGKHFSIDDTVTVNIYLDGDDLDQIILSY